MQIDHLKYLLAIDKYHSITIAAQRLYLGQTTLSTIVRDIEQELGFPIFHRNFKGVATTQEGKKALQLAGEICDYYEKIKSLAIHEEESLSSIPVITSPSIVCSLALPLYAAFQKLHPTKNLEFHLVPGGEVGNALINNNYNIGLAYITDPSAYKKNVSRYQLHVSPLMEDHLYLLVRRDHPFARRSGVHCLELENQSFALLSHFDLCEGAVPHFKLFGTHNLYHVYPNVPMVKKAVLTQNMIAVLNGYAIARDHSVDNDQLVPIALLGMPGENVSQLCLLYQSDGNLHCMEKLLIQCIHQFFKTELGNMTVLPHPQGGG